MIKKIKVSKEKFDEMTKEIKSTLTSEDGYVYPIKETRNSGYIVQSFLITFNVPNGDIYAYSPLYKTTGISKADIDMTKEV